MKICPQCSKEFGDEYHFCPDDGTPLAKIVKQQDPLIGKMVKGKYEVLEMVREDNLGRMFKSRQMPLGRTVLLEIFNSNLTSDEKFHARLSDSIRKYSKLQHVNIGTIYDMDETEDHRFFITSEFVEGRPLTAILKSEAPLEQERALNLFYQIADALHQAHANLIEHGYLTPQDIIVYTNPDGKECVQVMNFGISKLLLNEKFRHFNETQDINYLSVEEVAYISPDLATNPAAVDDLDDIYSFGVILYQALSGGLPFQADTADAMMEALCSLEAVPLRQLPQCRAINPQWDSVIDHCLQKKKSDRFQSIKEIKVILQRIGEGLKHEAEPTIMRMKTDLARDMAGEEAERQAQAERLDTTEVVPPPAPGGKKKSPPLSKTLMIQRKELMEEEAPPEELPEAPPEELPAVPPLAEGEIMLEEIGAAQPDIQADRSAAEDDTFPPAPEPPAEEPDEGKTLFIGGQGAAAAPPPADTKTVFIGTKPPAADVYEGKTVFIGDRPPTLNAAHEAKTVFIGGQGPTTAHPPAEHAFTDDEDTLSELLKAPAATPPPAEEDLYGKTMMVDTGKQPAPPPPAPPPPPPTAPAAPAPDLQKTVFAGPDLSKTVFAGPEAPAPPPPPPPPPPAPTPAQGLPAYQAPPPLPETKQYEPLPQAPAPPPPPASGLPPLPPELASEPIRLRRATGETRAVTPPPAGPPEEVPAGWPAPPEGAPAPPKGKSGAKIVIISVAAVVFLGILAVGAFLVYYILKPKYGSVTVRSYPDQAAVYLDGDQIGMTPTTQENIEAGNHLLKVAKGGYKPIEKEIAIEANKNLKLDIFQLEKIGETATTTTTTPQGPTEEQIAQIEDLRGKADLAYSQKRYIEPQEDCALTYCQQILQLDAQNPFALEMRQKIVDAVKERAGKAAAAKNWFLAEKLYTQLVQIAPDDPELPPALEKASAEVKLLQAKKTETIKDLSKRAQSAFTEGRLVTPPEDNAYELCSQIKRLENTNKFANGMIQRIKNQVPLQADEAILSENYDKAKTLIMAYNRYYPGDRAMEAKLDRLNQKLADLDSQRQQQERDRQQQETANRGRTLMANGIAEYKRGNYSGAVDLLEQSVKIDAQQPDAYFYLGASYLELKNFGRAQEYFKRAIQLKPDYALAHLNLGILAQTDRNWDLAITHLQRVAQLGGVPNYPVDKLQGMIRELEIRKSFGALVNRSIAVEHKHVFGGCSGYMSFTPDSIRYETSESKDGFTQPLKAVKGLSFSKGSEMNFQIGEKKYKFEIKNANAFGDIQQILPEYLKILK